MLVRLQYRQPGGRPRHLAAGSADAMSLLTAEAPDVRALVEAAADKARAHGWGRTEGPCERDGVTYTVTATVTGPRPSIDHGTLSPSGRVSDAAQRAARERSRAELFPPGTWDREPPSDADARAQQIDALRRRAAELRRLADAGMRPRKHRALADALERQAADLEQQ